MIMSKVGSNISFKLRSSWAHSSRLRLCLGFKVFGFLGFWGVLGTASTVSILSSNALNGIIYYALV